MSKWKKKPIVIEAFCWTGDDKQTEDPQWIIDAINSCTVRFENAGTTEVTMMIDTLEGTHRANRGDYIIQGIQGELYPCKPDIFLATYESVDITPSLHRQSTVEGVLAAARDLAKLPCFQYPIEEDSNTVKVFDAIQNIDYFGYTTEKL